jgi:hypothetical protein
VVVAVAAFRGLVQGPEEAWPAAARRVTFYETIPQPFPAAGLAPAAVVVRGLAI